ncbi:fimbrial protein [Pantoea stewartii]|uniref:fimbrial protein n=1 Tax=Pantoea stewartii TaxID=66269 RepID=UPI00197F21E0|nr:fimbrial protein [Pantoea stewartii]
MNNIFIYRHLKIIAIIILSTAGFLLSVKTSASDEFVDIDNINVSGKLVISTCEVIDASEDHLVDFSEVNVKDIYSYSPDLAKEFTITAKNCQPGNELTIDFSGVESETLPGFLHISGQAEGIAIGLKSGGVNGSPVLINSHSPVRGSVDNDDVFFVLGAYIQGEPQAVKNKTVMLGDFTATANFTLRYE